ncbi:TrbC/VirB2 family protein [Rhizobium sp. VS19-DR104.2]|uniref:TrbC/VirB2 family protein n=1 Tax=Rhizobium/Agrobacterium group TaxID=227290 RepID=UPI001CC7236A|nr:MULTISPECIES: TrbC/VirB2 family protein [unclassified Rhizobium]MBZ5763333.1 TrbC/VirB2 family protein [Rhizobium sp. VS19-DR96]MBZ5769228.1 TrbC/VirB2 family protein [Rhizobium sp. VS19-DR129.2]MBZ5776777.1 TrbC/VirB2 family protein [Rhizobium sp. VS19-DRK62.2]MBZ5788203.1 TrbC/VirB2 family protein [Rhizobium sp. VS19-DR121]MBZ5805286.1 TrbC/VirB2 family protein [Rhizobium sp. VS19-DR181]
MNTPKQYGTAAATFGLLMMLSATAQAAGGVDTGSSSMTSIQTWMMTWIPIAATILIIVSAIAWIAHLLRADWAVRIVVGLIVVGSASYLVGLFGLGGG